MTRKELAKLGSSKVRKDSALFSLFKTYITEDAAHIFSGGKLPAGCFGCSFGNYFRQWSAYVLQDEKIIVMEGSKTYKLQTESYRVYFKGQVLSKASTDKEWIDWIQYSKEHEEARKEKFSVLPEALRPKKKAEPEGAETKPAESREDVQPAPAQAPKKRGRAKKAE